MLIKDLQLKGWRSYSQEGLTLHDLKKMNLLIGPNNVGKSNLLKYFLFLREIFPEGDEGAIKKNVSYSRIRNTDRWLFGTEPVHFGVTIEDSPYPYVSTQGAAPEVIRIEANHHDTGKLTEFSVIEPTGLREQESILLWRQFISHHVRFIGDVRGFVYNTAGNLDVHVDGTKIMNFLLEKVGSEDGWIPDYESKMSQWLKEILQEDELSFHFIAEPNPYFTMMVKRGPNKELLSFKPRQLGTGIAHLVLILTTLHACSHRKMNIFLEEPEMNLHPQSVVALTKILKEDFPNHRYFIFTHSNVWLDQIDEEYSVFHFYNKEDGSTACRNCTEAQDFYSLFDKLGIRPSQLLLSNFNIWIEGPSDRIYLNYWIHRFSNGTLVEGKHYTFVMYGGANLAHYDLVFNDLINILSVGYHTAIICDSDLSNKRDTIKDRVQSIKDRIEEKDLKDYSMLWITEGREIENYVPKKLFEEVLASEFKRHYILYREKQVKLHPVTKPHGEDYTRTDSYDDFFVYLYDFNEGEIRARFQEHLTSEADFQALMKELEKKKKNILKDIPKVELAKAVARAWERFGDDDIYDLKSEMSELIARIKKANVN
ncbi:hypothetical protein D3C76_284630 [compost metagenome]